VARRGGITVVVALLVVTAGCAGFVSDDEGTPVATGTETGTSKPAATPPTASNPSDVSYPAGWNAAGVNASAALRTHYTAFVTGPSTTVTYRSTVIESRGASPRNTTLDMRLDTTDRRLHAVIEGKANHRAAYFADGTLSRWDVRNETLIGQSDARFVRVAQSMDSRVLHSQLLLYDLEFERTGRRQGTTALVYNVTGAYSNTVSGTYGSVENATGHVVVSTDGRILEIETTVTYAKGVLRYHYAQTRLGETAVKAPDWFQRA